MLDIARLSNSSVVMDRGDIETVLRALVAFQQASSAAAEILLARLDDLDGDPDLGPDGDERDSAWIEWHTMRGSQKRGPNIAQAHEDAEDDDHGEEDDPSGQCDEDGLNLGLGYRDRLPDGLNYLKTRPEYGSDQSLGPVNSTAAYRAHMQNIYGQT